MSVMWRGGGCAQCDVGRGGVGECDVERGRVCSV